MNKLMAWLTHPPMDGPWTTLLLRLTVGGVVFWEEILEFVNTSQSLTPGD